MMKGIQPNASPLERIESLKGRNDPGAVRAVATEMESLFVHEMLKALRRTVPGQGAGGLGGAVYTSLFDMEISRLIAERGLGLREMLIREIQRSVPAQAGPDAEGAPDAADGGGGKMRSLSRGMVEPFVDAVLKKHGRGDDILSITNRGEDCDEDPR